MMYKAQTQGVTQGCVVRNTMIKVDIERIEEFASLIEGQ